MNQLKPEWIAALYADSAPACAEAAAAIYRLGRERALSATRTWFQNPAFAALCGATPAVTVGLAVRQDTFALIRAANDFPHLADVPPEQDATEFELHFAGGIALDILTTRDPHTNGAVAKFLAKQGEGIQQVEFRCSDVNRAATILRDYFGQASIYPEKRPGANHTQVNFFLASAPDSTKVLIELYE
jgi:methylmalonyl-CoA/ethylmalonyl-CoA epimerase